MDVVSLYVGLVVGVPVGMLIAGLWIERSAKRSETMARFEKDRRATRR
jgi:uncharacterized membrane-anchored protein YhcB (DUF1043 family)